MAQSTDYRHAFPVFILLGVCMVFGLILRTVLYPDTYGDRGPYRAAAEDEAVNQEWKFSGGSTCTECMVESHEEATTAHAKDLHGAVECENCHGLGAKHLEDPEANPLVKPEGREPCLVCHRALQARYSAFPQVDWEKHFEAVGVSDPSTECTSCHSPHEPLYLEEPLSESRLHPLVHRCRDCHVGRTDEDMERPEKHPTVFSCDYCHKELVKDFKDRTHADVSCTTCHLYVRENDFSGRIIKNAAPDFCLLCHRNQEFRPEYPAPGIDWPEHREEMGDEDESDLQCIDCHDSDIHGPHGGKKDE